MSDTEITCTQLVLYQNSEVKEAIRGGESEHAVVLREPGTRRAGMWTYVGEVQVIA